MDLEPLFLGSLDTTSRERNCGATDHRQVQTHQGAHGRRARGWEWKGRQDGSSMNCSHQREHHANHRTGKLSPRTN